MPTPLIDCERCRAALSARLDDEDPGVPSEAVHMHLAQCAACRTFETDATSLHRTVRVASAPPVPDLTPRILAAIGEAPEASGRGAGTLRRSEPTNGTAPTHGDTAHRDAWRAALAVVALVQIAFALPALVLGDDVGLSGHNARHLGSFALALGVGFLVVAWRPNRAAGLFPLVAVLVACLVLTSAVDIANGRTGAAGELTHVTELLGLALCWLVGRSSEPEGAPARMLPGPA